ncbi:protein BTG3 [Gadus macrocephalus]|uniref:protein BTG3 n=1 Tax=Gadus macrocephalus TaxID=80720 RepID=UPI0028CB2B65|nr:protein BTG3 [Gadus macrocephalus]
MKKEIAAVVFFLKRLIKKGEKLDSAQIEKVVERLAAGLQEKFRGHWYPENPSQGQAFRCIRVNQFQMHDPVLLRACQESEVKYSDLSLPRELTLWMDPGEVCCRYGETNPYFSVASFSEGEADEKEVARKVTSALERVTSDYSSGSSSDEDCTLRETPGSSALTIALDCTTHQVMNPNAPTWNPKKKMAVGKGHPPVRPHYSVRPHGRLQHPLRHNVWVPEVYRAGHGYWGGMHNMAHSYG